MNKFVVPKLIGLATLTMITLVVLSFIEVTVYSYLINPGQNESVYEAHANASAPYISAVFGFVIFFLVVRYWKKTIPEPFSLSLTFSPDLCASGCNTANSCRSILGRFYSGFRYRQHGKSPWQLCRV